MSPVPRPPLFAELLALISIFRSFSLPVARRHLPVDSVLLAVEIVHHFDSEIDVAESSGNPADAFVAAGAFLGSAAAESMGIVVAAAAGILAVHSTVAAPACTVAASEGAASVKQRDTAVVFPWNTAEIDCRSRLVVPRTAAVGAERRGKAAVGIVG